MEWTDSSAPLCASSASVILCQLSTSRKQPAKSNRLSMFVSSTSISWERSDECVHFTQGVSFIRFEDVVVGVSESNNVGRWYARLERVRLSCAANPVFFNDRCFAFGSGVDVIAEVMRARHDGEDGSGDLRVFLLTEHDCQANWRRRRWVRRLHHRQLLFCILHIFFELGEADQHVVPNFWLKDCAG